MAVELPTYNSVHVLESPSMDEAIGAEYNGFKWVQVHATGLANPNVLSAWFKIFAAHTVETGLQCV